MNILNNVEAFAALQSGKIYFVAILRASLQN